MAAGISGIGIGWFLRFIIALGKRGSMELEIKEMLLAAREEAEKITSEAEKEGQENLKQAKEEANELKTKLQKTEERLIAKEELLDKRQVDIDEDSEELKQKSEELKQKSEYLEELDKQKISALEKVTSLSKDEAKEELLESSSKQVRRNCISNSMNCGS